MNWRAILTWKPKEAVPTSKTEAIRQAQMTLLTCVGLLVLGLLVGIFGRGHWILALSGWLLGLLMLGLALVTLGRWYMTLRDPKWDDQG
jgi:hypothetical protein